MKFSLSKSEIRAMIQKSFNLPAEVEIEIVEDTSAELHRAKAIMAGMAQYLLPGGMEVIPAQKIASIKHLRSIVPGMGLSEAKWLVEHWSEVVGFVNTKNRFPETEFDGMYHHKLK